MRFVKNQHPEGEKKPLSLLRINFKKKNKRTGAFCYDAAACAGLFRLSQMTCWVLLCLAFDWDFGERGVIKILNILESQEKNEE